MCDSIKHERDTVSTLARARVVVVVLILCTQKHIRSRKPRIDAARMCVYCRVILPERGRRQSH